MSMDGFALPAFESISILKDKDIVWVKKRGGNSNKAVKLDNADDDFLEELECVGKQPVHITIKFLGNEEFEKEPRGYIKNVAVEDELESIPMTEENMDDANVAFKKRKALKKLKIPKMKKQNFIDAEESPVVLEGTVNDNPFMEKERPPEDRSPLHQSGSVPNQQKHHHDDNDDTLPVVTKPGHIKFSTPDKVNGQEYGQEKVSRKWTIYEILNEDSAQESGASEKESHQELLSYGPSPSSHLDSSYNSRLCMELGCR